MGKSSDMLLVRIAKRLADITGTLEFSVNQTTSAIGFG
jgi:hypothetical protein